MKSVYYSMVQMACQASERGDTICGMSNEISALYKHILATVLEWRLKLGLPREGLWLNYPREEVEDLWGAPFDEGARLALAKEARPTLGELVWQDKGDHLKVFVPKEGVAFASTLSPDPFLVKLIETSRDPFLTMEGVEALFAPYPHTVCPLPDDVDAKVYHVEGDDMVYVFDDHDGLVEYHRLTLAHYERLYGQRP